MNKNICFCFIVLIIAFASCKNDYVPKPRGYFRINLPEKKYVHYASPQCPFSFDIPEYANVLQDTNRLAEPCWFYITFPTLNGQLYFTYKSVKNNFQKLTEDNRNMVYKHTAKASAINETVISNNGVYGISYEIGGNAASNMQFYLTDSVNHFLRGSLYFYAPPQSDSLAPVINFVQEDVRVFINSFQWK
jgi:gliding motility-associated lipoprotein GldD